MNLDILSLKQDIQTKKRRLEHELYLAIHPVLDKFVHDEGVVPDVSLNLTAMRELGNGRDVGVVIGVKVGIDV